MFNKIERFSGDYRFLSNFHPCDITYNGINYKSTENAYQAQKTNDKKIQFNISTMTPAQSKLFGSKINLNSDWDDKRLLVMYEINKLKYKIPELRKLLLDTGSDLLIEGNWWNDKFWGVCLKTNKGDNFLGEILMGIRKEIQDGKL